MSQNRKRISSILILFMLTVGMVFSIPPVLRDNSFLGDKSTNDPELDNNFKEIPTNLPKNIIPSSSSNYAAHSSIFPWWNPSYTFRIPIEINSSFIDRIDYSVKISINFTEYTKDSTWHGPLDPTSIRVIEYNDTGSENEPVVFNSSMDSSNYDRYAIPSLFIPLDGYSGYDTDFDYETNANGLLWFQLNGNSSANTNRTYMVYFDTTNNLEDLSAPDYLIWSKDYNWNTDVVGDGNFRLAFSTYQEIDNTGFGDLRIMDENMEQFEYNDIISEQAQRVYGFTPGDFDGDGKLEILTTDSWDDFFMLEYSESSGEWIPSNDRMRFDTTNAMDTWITPAQDWTHSNILAADLDHDGKDELITTQRRSSTQTGGNYTVIYNFTKSQSGEWDFALENYWATGDYALHTISLADLDNNGYLDLIGAPIHYGMNVGRYSLVLYMNNGTNDWEEVIQVGGDSRPGAQLPEDIGSIQVGDIDNDGNIEIVVSEWDNYRYLYFWEYNESNELEFEQRYQILHDNTLYPFNNPLVGAMYDWDRDGYTEISICNVRNGYSSLRLIKCLGNENEFIDLNDRFEQVNVWGEYGNNSIPFRYMGQTRFGDTDNDGEIEMISSAEYSHPTANLAQVQAWNQDSQTPEWFGPTTYRRTGGYYRYHSMMSILGGWDNIIYRMEPFSFIHGIGVRKPNLNIQILDKNMGPVENAEVKISYIDYEEIETTDSNGRVTFTYLNDTTYAVVVNCTNNLGNMDDITAYAGTITIDKNVALQFNKTCLTNIMQVYFDFDDVDGNSFNQANVTIYNHSVAEDMSISEIDLSENNNFIWLDRTGQDVPNEYNVSLEYINEYYSSLIDLGNYTVNNTDYDEYGALFNQTLFNAQGDTCVYTFEYETENLLNWVNISIYDAYSYVSKVDVYLVLDTDELITSWDLSS
ncbi:MAG: VCBS repeat-containing protein, partial [archaeon]|nr:VCBS repeat-containing protein [archaeon]